MKIEFKIEKTVVETYQVDCDSKEFKDYCWHMWDLYEADNYHPYCMRVAEMFQHFMEGREVEEEDFQEFLADDVSHEELWKEDMPYIYCGEKVSKGKLKSAKFRENKKKKGC